MKANMGIIDRLARFVAGLALIGFALGLVAPGTGWNWVGWIGVVPLATSIIGNCPAYSLFGWTTR
ncbi:MAG: DUF2892 domain-containing protein [Pseudolabrys sp.]